MLNAITMIEPAKFNPQALAWYQSCWKRGAISRAFGTLSRLIFWKRPSLIEGSPCVGSVMTRSNTGCPAGDALSLGSMSHQPGSRMTRAPVFCSNRPTRCSRSVAS